jgi:glyoxylase-like metal-dependent hydrolase (beta-lactamase superfamily II)
LLLWKPKIPQVGLTKVENLLFTKSQLKLIFTPIWVKTVEIISREAYPNPQRKKEEMTNYICVTCGVQHEESAMPPEHCRICEDERQYVGHKGQRWTTLPEMQREHHNRIEEVDAGLTGIGSVPTFGIGQRALLVQTPNGNVLWDCISLLDDSTVEAVRALGGISAIAVSHPHLVGSLVEWSHAFDNAPIYWHADNRQWVMRPDPSYVFWEGETQPLVEGIRLIRCGGHFEGSTVLHWAQGGEGRGALLTGDTMQVAADRRYVSFMYSYPNMTPLNKRAIERIVRAVEPYEFDRIYGGWWDFLVLDAKAALRRSAERYIQAISA